MGEYFLMSKRFNKETCEDFGLVQTEDRNIAVNPKDKSLWKRCRLYDLGWGKENGYYKIPLSGFEKLLDIFFNTDDEEDKYGAASVILDFYPEQLLEESERLILGRHDLRKLKTFINFFHLDDPANKTPTQGKTTDEILNDYERWMSIAEHISKKKL